MSLVIGQRFWERVGLGVDFPTTLTLSFSCMPKKGTLLEYLR